MHRQITATIAILLVAVGFLPASGGAAMEPPEPQRVGLSCATDMFIQQLGRSEPATADGQVLVLVRATFEPGGGIGPHTHPGSLVLSIESGTFGFTLIEDGEMMVMRSGEAGTPEATEMLTPGQEVALEPGDWFVEMGMVHSARVIGDEPVVLHFAGLLADGQPMTTCVEGTPTP